MTILNESLASMTDQEKHPTVDSYIAEQRQGEY